ncbi:hypothetical protein, partial [Negadavirga shengliensis]
MKPGTGNGEQNRTGQKLPCTFLPSRYPPNVQEPGNGEAAKNSRALFIPVRYPQNVRETGNGQQGNRTGSPRNAESPFPTAVGKGLLMNNTAAAYSPGCDPSTIGAAGLN